MKHHQIQISTPQHLLELGAKLASHCQPPLCVYLQGALGAGKTTLVRGILNGFGYSGKVKSPTFTLVEPYEFNNLNIFHFDLYRLDKNAKQSMIGLSDYHRPDSILLIEWPEHGKDWLPQPDLTCYIDIIDAGRTITLTAGSERGEKIIQGIR